MRMICDRSVVCCDPVTPILIVTPTGHFAVRDLCGSARLAQPICVFQCLLDAYADHQDSKFFAAMSCDQHIILLSKISEYPGYFDYHFVTKFVAKSVVDRLKSVDVTHECDGISLCLFSCRQHRDRHLIKGPSIK